MNAGPNAQPMPSLAVRLLIACRPWSAPISAVPVLLGALLAVTVGGATMRWGLLAATLVASWAAHAAANMFSDIFDFRNGLDREPFPVSGSLVRGWLTVRQTARLATVCLVLGAGIGAALIRTAGPSAAVLAGLGLALLLAYPGLKRLALGDAAVFAAFGPLLATGAWTVFTGNAAWLPALWIAPFGLVVIAVLHANNWRDRENDLAHGVRSVAGLLGDRGSLVYYGFLIFSPFVFTAALIELPRILGPAAWVPMPRTFYLVFLGVPSALRLWARARRRHAPRDPMEFLALDGATANFMIPLGILNLAAALAAGLL